MIIILTKSNKKPNFIGALALMIKIKSKKTFLFPVWMLGQNFIKSCFSLFAVHGIMASQGYSQRQEQTNRQKKRQIKDRQTDKRDKQWNKKDMYTKRKTA